MGSHYSALLIIDAPNEIEIEHFLYKLTENKYELVEGEKQLIAGFPDFPNIVVCKQSNVIFIYGEVKFGTKDFNTQYPQYLPKLSTNCSIFYWTIEDTSGCKCFDFFVNEVHKRSWFMDGDENISNIGDPFPIESSTNLSDEWGIVEIGESFGFSWDKVIETPCSIYRPISYIDTNKQKEFNSSKKTWWKFW